jgi:hypothetical protein
MKVHHVREGANAVSRYAIFLYTSQVAEVCGDEHNQHSADLDAAGSIVAAFALRPPETGRAIREHLVTDGPYAETKEVIAGFYVIEADDLDAATKVALENPILRQGGGLEIRPVQ